MSCSSKHKFEGDCNALPDHSHWTRSYTWRDALSQFFPVVQIGVCFSLFPSICLIPISYFLSQCLLKPNWNLRFSLFELRSLPFAAAISCRVPRVIHTLMCKVIFFIVASSYRCARTLLAVYFHSSICYCLRFFSALACVRVLNKKLCFAPIARTVKYYLPFGADNCLSNAKAIYRISVSTVNCQRERSAPTREVMQQSQCGKKQQNSAWNKNVKL